MPRRAQDDRMDTVELLEARVGALLGELGYPGTPTPGRPTVVQVDGQPVVLTCFVQDEATWVRAAAPVLTEVEPSLELLHRVLQLGQDVLFGTPQLFEDGTVAFSATLFGHNLDEEALARTLRYVAHVARTHGHRLHQLVGGTLWGAQEDATGG